jgi:hypothetical protein
MFRILCDPSSWSTELCLTKIPRGGSWIFCRVLGSVILNLWCVCTVRPLGGCTLHTHHSNFSQAQPCTP